VANVVAELRLGTRGSPLALWQANAVAARIAEHGGPACRLVVIKTTGDRLQEEPLSVAGGKRLFVKEIEDALLRNHIDLAVHSSKDLPAVLPPGLEIASVLPREDPLDAIALPAMTGRHEAITLQPSAMRIDDLLVRLGARLGQTPAIGTGSVRRIAQLARLFPNARFEPIRGNLDTRLRKLDSGRYSALVLAAAGLRRLGYQDRISMTLPAEVCVPAPGQGIIAIEVRRGDGAVRDVVSGIRDAAAAAALDAERAVVEALGGGCQTPVGALATPGARGEADDGVLELVACVVSLDGSRVVRGHECAPIRDAKRLGARVGAQLMNDGAGEILAASERRSNE
jgi:hydroxymethylbilane synthase